MASLNALDIAEMMQTCRDYPGYKGLVVFESAQRKREFVQEMQRYVDNEDMPGVLGLTRYGHIKFENGSSIGVTTSQENTLRGLKANSVIFDGISQEIIDAVRMNLTPFIVGDKEIAVKETYEGKEIDDFLNGFTIIT